MTPDETIEVPCNLSRRYYKKLFSQDPNYSTPYPNPDEAARWSKIEKFLCDVVTNIREETNRQLRILDIGCGRGWLTNLASIYGDSEGVDPVPESIQTARSMFQHLKFITGTAVDVYKSLNSRPFDVVIATEVLEHIIDKVGFLEDITRCLHHDGYVIITTPRGELFDKWNRMGYEKQPIERWLTESEVVKIFKECNLVPVDHDRIYLDLATMSLFHRICASRKVKNLFRRLGSTWFQKRLQYAAAIYQIWCFQYKNAN